MIGLRRDRVELVEHDPEWTLLAAQACLAVRNACGELLSDVQHVGSTAVPDLPAKPILDLAGGLVTLDWMPEIIRRLTPLGYLYRGDYQDSGGHLFVVESSADVRTIHLHLVGHGGSQWRNYLFFRDLLLNSCLIRRQYAELKRHLARDYRDDRQSYASLKADFISEILARAGESTG